MKLQQFRSRWWSFSVFPMALLMGGITLAKGADIAVLYALEADWQAFVKESGTDPSQFVASGNRNIQRMRCLGHNVTAVKMGSGCTETAVSATCVLSMARFDLMITMGPAGSLRDSLAPGTMVVIDRLVPWQASDTKAKPLDLPFTVAGPAAGSRPLQSKWQLCDGTVLGGVFCASGELFINTSIQRSELAVRADIVDMNTLGVETAAAAFQVPCLHLRVISDKANEDAREDFLKFSETWKGACGVLASKIVRTLKEDPSRPSSYEELRKIIPGAIPLPGRGEEGKGKGK